jgi:hypothetical protein
MNNTDGYNKDNPSISGYVASSVVAVQSSGLLSKLRML